MSKIFAAAALAILASSFEPAQAAQATSAPAAFYVFCATSPSQCAVRGPVRPAMALTPALMSQLESVNRDVNGSVREYTDEQIFGQADIWSLPTNGKGDCEDFALMKRHQLIEMGWPSSVLLMTVVRNRQGEGHAVLTVVTDRGDFILDNQTSRISTSTESGLQFFSRQSQSNPRSWVVVPRDGAPDAVPAAVSLAVPPADTAPGKPAPVAVAATAPAAPFFPDPASSSSN